MEALLRDDPEVAALARREAARNEGTLNLIAAESHAPPAVMEALGSIFNTKTIEGYPGRRFHAGCRHADAVERLATERAAQLFGAQYVNVQPHSGTAANLAVFFSVLQLGDRVLAMSLPSGGHLSHGHAASITGRCFTFRHYPVDPQTERIDYDAVHSQALSFRPRLLVAGASAYPRLIDYERMAAIAADVAAYLFVDMAHLAGLVAARVIPSPVAYSDFVTFTAYKTLMGTRGGVILARQAHGRALDRAVFPGCQGTSAVNQIAAKAVTFKLAQTEAFKAVQVRTLQNAAALAACLGARGWRIVTGGTDTHQVLVDVAVGGLDGATAERLLERVGILSNRNTIPSDAGHPGRISGVRFGTGALAARGLEPAALEQVGALIDAAWRGRGETPTARRVAREVADLCRAYPVYAC